MDKLTLFAPGPLTATADPRVKSGLLLPYGEHGFTNLGKVLASAGSLKLAEKADPLTLEHMPKLPAADFIVFEEQEDGLHCSIRYLDTPLGNAALAEFEAGTRNGLSVEIDNPVIRGGHLVAGVVTGGSQVEAPAFPSAKLAAAEVEDAPDTEVASPDYQTVYEGELVPVVEIDGKALEGIKKVSVSEKKIEIQTGEEEAEPEPEDEEETMTAAKVQNAALFGGTKKTPDANALFAAFAAAAGGEPGKMLAALSDIVPANTLALEQPQYVGELWAGVPYARRYLPLFGEPGALTSWIVKAWQWVTPPEVAKYAGNKAAIPSAAIETAEATGVLQRFAGGHDIDRKYRDFDNPEFWAAYFAKMAESYAKQSDLYIRDLIREIPTVANGGRVHLLNSAMPEDVPPAIAMIVKGCIKVLNTLDTLPTFALVTTDYWEPLLYQKTVDVMPYLNAALGLEGGTLEGGGFKLRPVPTGALTATGGTTFTGKVLVGHEKALTVKELPGSPIRVEAIDVSKGGIDEGLFGYVGTMIENASGFALYDAPTAS